MRKSTLFVLLVFGILQGSFAPPVTKDKQKDDNKDDEIGGLEDYMEYHRYLKEVVNALESDPEFRKKLEKADESDIKSGKIAEELEFVSHHVRTRLDEIKRVELARLRELVEKKRQLQQNIDLEDPSHRHLDHRNPHTFEIDDLKKLIAKTTEDLAEADRIRREDFKQYELQKEYDKQVKLNHTSGAEKEKLEKELKLLDKEREEKHKKHEKLHEPGHKAQLEEVWEEQDQMQQEFDPKTFFMLHDVDSNGLWDQDEVKALFVKELEKMYTAGAPEDDMRERIEEMERMRESVFKEVDTNHDGFIDYEEFLAQTKRNDFQQDHGWQGLDEKRPYTDEELEEYIRRHQIHPDYPNQPVPPPVQYQQVPPGYHPNAVPPQQQFHPGQLPPQYAQQLPGHLPDLNTNEIYPHQQQPGVQQQPQVNYQQSQPVYQQPNQHLNEPPVNYQQSQYRQVNPNAVNPPQMQQINNAQNVPQPQPSQNQNLNQPPQAQNLNQQVPQAQNPSPVPNPQQLNNVPQGSPQVNRV